MDHSGAYVLTRQKVPTLVPEHLTAFFKRLRSRMGPARIRMFAVGEYGEVTKRPHYHAAIFGLPSCLNGRTQHLQKDCCSVCKMVKEAWACGGVDVGELNEESAKYIAGYCLKKYSKEELCQERRTTTGMNRPKYLMDGRHRPFIRMSLKPGIGAIALANLAISGVRIQRARSAIKCLDAPVVLRNSGSMLPLGRYLRRKWREALGRSPDTPKSVLEQYQQELQTVLRKNEMEYASGFTSKKAQAAFHHWRTNAGKIASMESRAKIYKQEKHL